MAELLPAYLECWGKARPASDESAPFHPAAYHCLDVAASAMAMLAARPVTRARAALLLGVPEADAVALIGFLAGLHDVGKFADGFQVQVESRWPPHYGPYPDRRARCDHTRAGFVLWDTCLVDSLGRAFAPDDPHALRPVMLAVFGHHGRPLSAAVDPSIGDFFTDQAKHAALSYVEDWRGLWRTVPSIPSDFCGKIPSWWLNGLLSVADWIGSKQEWFEYCAPTLSLAAYWEQAKERAEHAVRCAGLEQAGAAGERAFADLIDASYDPTPAQRWALDVPIPDGPSLFVLEDVTGSGKTEAAHVLVHRLMARGRASGAFWAMPTQATANGMYNRQRKIMRRLFVDDDARLPSLALAHSQSGLHEGFRATILGEDDGDGFDFGEETDDETDSVVACAAFLADDRRKSLLADVGAGTVDQAILGVLPSKFNTIRLLGLSEKVLVLDEVHAYDPYMFAEIQSLLRFQAALGGSAVVLSATLTQEMRDTLLHDWSRTVGGARRMHATRDARSPYPLASWVGGDGTVVARDVAASAQRRVHVRLADDTERVVDEIVRAAADGAAVAWIRNTVDSCLAAAELMRERGVEPIVFHARFAQGDRQKREAEVLELFGRNPEARRQGKVVLATQVIEQSLDLDFDLLVSDLAPIDLLIQRAGRLWRHPERVRAGVSKPEFVVLAPEFSDNPPVTWLDTLLRGTSAVYPRPDVLWRTLRLLRGKQCLVAPDEVRDLVEGVYGPKVVEDFPPSLDAKVGKAIGKASGDRAMADGYALKLAGGWTADTYPGWYSDIRVPTRLSNRQTVIRMARVAADGSIEPLHVGEIGEAWRNWALSEVKVSESKVRPGAKSNDVFRKGVDLVRRAWPRYERDVPVAVLESSNGLWVGRLTNEDGQSVELVYGQRDGLRFN